MFAANGGLWQVLNKYADESLRATGATAFVLSYLN